MKKYSHLFNWWIMTLLSAAGLGTAFYTKVIDKVIAADWSRLSFIILALLVYATGRTGYDLWQTYKNKPDLVRLSKRLHTSRMIRGSMLVLGILGTVVGIIFTLEACRQGFSNPSDTEAIRRTMNLMATGMGTALYTTGAGLVCSFILRWQLFNLNHRLSELGGEITDEDTD